MSTPVSDKLVTVAGLKEAYDALTEEPFVVDITSGQWSGSGSDYYITVTASNITANSILVVDYDKNSQQYLKGPVWAVPAAGSFTIHTSAVPTGTVKILVRFPGTMGEANYQVLADVYSKSQTYSKTEAVAKADIVNNLTNTDPTKALAAPQGKALNEAITQSTAIAEERLTFTYGEKSINIYFRTTGNVLSVLISNDVSSMAFPTSWTNVGALQTIRPASDRYIPLIAANGVIAVIRIYPDGGVRIVATSSTPGWWQTSGTVIYK